jgi:large subunit ribosomal protein L15
MKLHDLHPAEGAHKARTRVGRGIAAGKGKTAGRGTKGQKARAGGSIPPWFEGGQTPLHMRIPKLRGFKNRFKVEYEVVNVGAIGALVERGAFEVDAPTGKAAKTANASAGSTQITINADILRAVGLVRTPSKPLKILGAGDLSAALFVVADAFTASARAKIEAAGGLVNVLEVPSTSAPALGVEATEPAQRRARPVADQAPAVDAAPEVAAPEAAAPEPAVTEASAADAPAAEVPAAVEAAPEAVPVADEPAMDADATPETASTKPARAETPRAKPAAKAKATPKAKAKTATTDAPADETAATASDEAETPSGDDT